MKATGLLYGFVLAFTILSCTDNASAQNYYDDEYDYLFDADHRVVIRKDVPCTEDWQDLWNGDYVRIAGNYINIYRNGSRFLYGNNVWLMHNGRYIIALNGYEYMVDDDGYRIAYGDTVDLLWNGVYRIRRGGYWYLYTDDGYRLGGIYSDEQITAYWNGTYCYHSGGYYRVADEDGDQISNSYSDEEPRLLNSGDYRVWRGSNTYVITP